MTRPHQTIIPEEYEPRSTHGRSGFQWNKQHRPEETYRSSEYNTTGASWERGIERGTTGTLRESIGEEDPNVQSKFMYIQEINKGDNFGMYQRIKPQKLDKISHVKVTCKKVSPRVSSLKKSSERKVKLSSRSPKGYQNYQTI